MSQPNEVHAETSTRAALTETLPRLFALCRYASIASAFQTPLEYHEETKRRMYEMGKHRYKMDEQTEEQKQARDRMALFPKDAEVLFVQEDL